MGKLLAVVLVLVSIAAIVGLALRPGTVIGVSDDALAESIARAADTPRAGRCEGGDERRLCRDDRSTYRVEIGDLGCWDATVAAGGDEGQGRRGGEPTLTGCVTILDLVGIG